MPVCGRLKTTSLSNAESFSPTCPHHRDLGTGSFAGVVYPYEGGVKSGVHEVPAHVAALLSQESEVEVTGTQEPVRFLLLAGRPLNGPAVQYGPFGMSSVEEIQQAVANHQGGRPAQA